MKENPYNPITEPASHKWWEEKHRTEEIEPIAPQRYIGTFHIFNEHFIHHTQVIYEEEYISLHPDERKLYSKYSGPLYPKYPYEKN